MAKKKEEYRKPAGINDEDINLTIMNIAVAPEREEDKTRAEAGKEITKEDIIMSTDLEQGVVIKATDGIEVER